MAHESGRTLRSEDELAHYRIVGPLGAGGMGEVYLAQDRTLERNVALKILPPDLVRSEDRVRRFMLEAKSASSLSHPNIVTIYEIGEDAVRSPGAEPSSSVHYISMELVNGKTLSALIHDERTDLRTLLGWLGQAADGLAKAHGAGIVHRDLKPGNIMVTNDGYAKVLDFGLAKLTEKRAGAADASATGGPALTQDATGVGVIVGTVGYMAPEQVAGKSIDHRADIFSFGCILYEAATRRAPFAAETSVETMHRILNEKPAPIEEINPQVPAELRRLIRRCLAKNPEQRLQSMKDLALELREIVDDYDALSASASSGSVIGGAAAMGAPARRGLSPAVIALAAVVVLALAAAGWWAMSRGGKPAQDRAFSKMRMTTVTSRGDVRDCALSADGRYLAYTAGRPGAITLRVHQVATGSDVEVVPPSRDAIDSPSFTPDGNYLYFRMRRRDAQSYSALYQVPSLGGTPQERAFDVDSRATFAPDGKRLVFWRNVPTEGENRLVEYDLDAAKERIVTAVKHGEYPAGAPAWSPDGRQIAAALFSPEADLTTTIALFDPATGKRRDHTSLPRTVGAELTWLADGSGFAMAAQQVTSSGTAQLFLVGYPDKSLQRVTNDFQDYSGVGASGGEEAIGAVRQTRLSNVWVVSADGGEPRPLTRAANPENSPGGLAAPDSATLVFGAARDAGYHLWSIPVTGGEPRMLTSGSTQSVNPAGAAGRVIFDRLGADGVHVWTMNADGSDLTQRTTGSGEQHGGVSRDGRWLGYGRYSERGTVRFLALPAGTAGPVLTTINGIHDYTADGQRVLVGRYARDERGLQRTMLSLNPLDGSAATDSVLLPGDAAGARLSPDQRGIDYIATSDSAANLRRLGFGGGTPTPVTRFTSGRVTSFVHSPDGSRLAIVVRDGPTENVWVADGDGSNPRQMTQFTGEEVFELVWVDAHRTIAIGAGTLTNDVVLVRDFR